MKSIKLRYSTRTQCDDHFGTKFETRSEDAGAQLVFSCQLWQLSDNFSELHDQARQLRIQNAYSSRETKEQARSSAIRVRGKLPPVLWRR